MKKINVILVALLFVCAIFTLSFAQIPQSTAAKTTEAKTEIVRGKIISVDTIKNIIVVKVNATGTEKSIAVDPMVISSLKVDDDVKVALKAGSNVAEKVKKIIKKSASTKK